MRHLKTFELIEAVTRAGSIRKAAEDANITASALNRRIKAFEDEFGSEIFERLPRGMRLNPAGELLMEHIRSQRYDMQRIQSQVSDLSGVRRGHVSIACSQALLPYFLPKQIAIYRREHPNVSFSVNVRDRVQAERDLATFSSDLALVFEPVHLVDFEVLHMLEQPVHAIVQRGSPLAGKSSLRLRDLQGQRLAMPTPAFGVRHLLDLGMRRKQMTLRPDVETESFELIRYYVTHENAVGFQIPIGLDSDQQNDIVHRPISKRDLDAGQLLLGQMKGRVLSVASARFAMQLMSALAELAAA